MKRFWRALCCVAVSTLLAACSALGPAASGARPLSPSTPIEASASLAAAPAGPFLAPGQQSGGVSVWLSSVPAEPVVGTAQIATWVLGADGRPIVDAQVTYDTDMTNMSHGLYEVAAKHLGAGQYAGDVHFSMAGPWRVITRIERPGQPPLRLRFEFRVKER